MGDWKRLRWLYGWLAWAVKFGWLDEWMIQWMDVWMVEWMIIDGGCSKVLRVKWVSIWTWELSERKWNLNSIFTLFIFYSHHILSKNVNHYQYFTWNDGFPSRSLHTYISGRVINLLSVGMYDNKKVKFMPFAYCLSLNYLPFFQEKKILHLSSLTISIFSDEI